MLTYVAALGYNKHSQVLLVGYQVLPKRNRRPHDPESGQDTRQFHCAHSYATMVGDLVINSFLSRVSPFLYKIRNLLDILQGIL